MEKFKSNNEFLMYATADGKIKIHVNIDLKQDTVWLTQMQMAELFDTTKQNISNHIHNIFNENELEEISVVKEFLTAANDGKNYSTKHYNLDVIISVGYRVKSIRGTQFRIWANSILKEYIIKGFTMNDELLKEAGGGSYFKELLERLRDIRSSEKVFYRQILDIYATSIDYNPKAEMTIEFFKIVQNKMHYAIHGNTAPELIMQRANADLPFMGLTAFFGSKPRKDEIILAKNYLKEDEIIELNRIVSMYLDYAEDQANRHQVMYMKDWLERLDSFLTFNEREILANAGKISHDLAAEHAVKEYEKYQEKSKDELTQVEKDFLDTIHQTYKLLEGKKKK